MLVENSVAVVSGGASGLGAAVVLELRERGADVVVIDLPSDDARARVEAAGATFVEADVTDPVAVSAAMDIAQAIGPLRTAVCCAGVATPGRALRGGIPLDLQSFDRVVRVNVTGTFNVASQAAARMLETPAIDGERGVVVMTSSVAAFDGQVGQAAYSASKAAVAGMTLSLARDFAEHQIRVVSIAPGMFRTPLLAGLPAAAIESLGRQVPHPARIGEPIEFAKLAAHIIDNSMINGEVIRIDGAIRMAPR